MNQLATWSCTIKYLCTESYFPCLRVTITSSFCRAGQGKEAKTAGKSNGCSSFAARSPPVHHRHHPALRALATLRVVCMAILKHSGWQFSHIHVPTLPQPYAHKRRDENPKGLPAYGQAPHTLRNRNDKTHNRPILELGG